jgi:hypothetical protein
MLAGVARSFDVHADSYVMFVALCFVSCVGNECVLRSII